MDEAEFYVLATIVEILTEKPGLSDEELIEEVRSRGIIVFDSRTPRKKAVPVMDVRGGEM